MRPMSDRQQVIFITGGGGGIGRAIAELFASKGYRVAITGRSANRLKECQEAITSKGGKCMAISLDIGSAKDVAKAVADVVAAWDGIDVLVNNAGLALGSPRPFHEQTLDDIDTVIGTNISGTLYVTHAVLQKSMMLPGKHGKVVGRGTIVNISSITGLDAPPMGEATYHTSKAAMEGFSNVLRQELTGTNIRVLVVRPGFVGGATNFHGNRLSDKSAERQVFQGLQPLQETDVANAVDYLVHAPERVSIRALDVVPTAQRALVNNDRTWNQRNGLTE